MRRLVLPLVALFCVPLEGLAAAAPDVPLQCLPPAEQEAAPEFEPVPARPLTYEEQRDLQRLFRDTDGRWRGVAMEEMCMLSGGAKQRRFDATLKAKASRDELELSGDYVQSEERTRRRFTKRLFLTPDGLRVDQRSKAGEVELLRAEPSILVYRHRYRIVFQREAEQQGGGASQVQQPVGGAGNLVASVSAAGAVTPATAKPAKSTSVGRAERVTLHLVDARNLRITQQFFTQGVYTGSMTWELRRD